MVIKAGAKFRMHGVGIMNLAKYESANADRLVKSNLTLP